MPTVLHIAMESDILYFVGRFHPLVVHLPIGILIVGFALEGMAMVSPKSSAGWNKALEYIWLGGALTGLMSVITGWLVAGEGNHMPNSVDWHRWMGMSVLVLTFVAWAMKSRRWKVSREVYLSNLALLALSLFITGHLGGKLTHGSDYLVEYAPGVIKKWVGQDAHEFQDTFPNNPDSALVFDHLIQPILKRNCTSCHNSDERKGGLDLTTGLGIMEGGDELPAVVPGKALRSGIFQRVTLPQSHSKFMPPRGRPLDFNEIRLLEWWIGNGASFSGPVSDSELRDDIVWILQENYGLDTHPKPFFEREVIDAIPPSVLDEIYELGFRGGMLAEGNHFVKLKAVDRELAELDWQRIRALKGHLVMLDLGDTNVDDRTLQWVGDWKNLYKLDLNNTLVTDEGLENLVVLERLEILNLYGTRVSDRGVQVLKSLPALKKIFLWGSEVTEGFVNNWRAENPSLEIIWQATQ